MARPRTAVAERFWSKVRMSDGCWEWTAARLRAYGGFSREGRLHPAHRIAFELVRGPIPEGMCVLHACDNPPCVRPSHLFLGTHAENMADMARKGRAQHRSGPRKTHCKRGHEYTPENTYYSMWKQYRLRSCRTCVLEQSRARAKRTA